MDRNERSSLGNWAQALVIAALVAIPIALIGAGDEPSDVGNSVGVYRHVVLFEFKESATEEDVADLEGAFARLADEVDEIIDFEWGLNVSPEDHAKGLTHCFLVTFRDRAGLDVYLPHEAHKSFVDQLLPHLEQVVVVDYVAAR